MGSSLRSSQYIEIPSISLESIGTLPIFDDDELEMSGLTNEERIERFRNIWQIAIDSFTDRQLQIFVMRFMFQMKGQEIATCLKCTGAEKIKRKKFSNPQEFDELSLKFKSDALYSVTQPYVAFVLRDLIHKVKKALKAQGKLEF